ncbi:cytochrome c oxidase accessory protein CcoG [Alcaligenes endophyticus]|uniref:Cytochrome c oxidase accessory protein CcoG n=1 Tax=Alcaligenes endophyticus TaxID=1929088 RepID=A0ABT8EI91_9BURK|nr:cytochrome c oxidase accessory protein CcoG [Alcaligenes endophyticus]MCX5592670.1 cytochrome c oxidase accessory protein CcoG [Alcaligenes endophyticus]MDN4120982.1 cytochrome c oxidase accessory protein CcoG [Alcaligenes endophyticus]
MSSPNPSNTEPSAAEQVPTWQPPRRKNAQGGTSPQVEKALVDVRQKIYPRSVTGVFARWRVWLVLATQIIFYGLPWIEWHGRQAVLFDLAARKFYLFGMILWPQDVIYLTVLLLLSAFSLFLFTAMAGRLFCGYACPQTVYTEIFMWVERKIEGDRLARIRLDEQPWTIRKIRIKALKHLAWVVIAFWTGYTFIGYFAPIRELGGDLLSLSLGPWQWFWLLFYAFATWGNAGFMREAVCKYMCPYARFQSVMVDNDTFVVTYDHVRGDPRGGRSRKIDHKSAGMGDCVDCSLCVQVCPTGIDIRDGLQYMCIGCGACVDACNQVMDKMSYEPGLIRYTSGRAITERLTQAQVRKRMLRPRVLSYILILTVIFGAFVYSLGTRVPMRMDIMRDRGALGREVPGGFYENVYQLQLINTSETGMNVSLSAAGLSGLTLQTAEGRSDQVYVEPAANRLVAVVARLPIQEAKPGLYNIAIEAVSHHENGRETVVTESTSFYVPQ